MARADAIDHGPAAASCPLLAATPLGTDSGTEDYYSSVRLKLVVGAWALFLGFVAVNAGYLIVTHHWANSDGKSSPALETKVVEQLADDPAPGSPDSVRRLERDGWACTSAGGEYVLNNEDTVSVIRYTCTRPKR